MIFLFINVLNGSETQIINMRGESEGHIKSTIKISTKKRESVLGCYGFR